MNKEGKQLFSAVDTPYDMSIKFAGGPIPLGIYRKNLEISSKNSFF